MAKHKRHPQRVAVKKRRKPVFSIAVSGNYKRAISSALCYALREHFDVRYEGEEDILSMEEADELIHKLCRGRPPLAVVRMTE